MVALAVDGQDQIGDPVPQRPCGDALGFGGGAVCCGEPRVAQDGADQVVGEHLGPERPEGDRRLSARVGDGAVGVFGVVGLQVVQ